MKKLTKKEIEKIIRDYDKIIRDAYPTSRLINAPYDDGQEWTCELLKNGKKYYVTFWFDASYTDINEPDMLPWDAANVYSIADKSGTIIFNRY